MRRRSMKHWGIVGFGAILAALDGLFKYFALENLVEKQDSFIFPFDIFLHRNYGIAFSLPLPLGVVIFLTIVVISVLILIFGHDLYKRRIVNYPIALIFLGAVGNLGDRIINGFTTDYLIFFGRSAINLSDVLIVSGLLLLFFYNKDVS